MLSMLKILLHTEQSKGAQSIKSYYCGATVKGCQSNKKNVELSIYLHLVILRVVQPHKYIILSFTASDYIQFSQSL